MSIYNLFLLNINIFFLTFGLCEHIVGLTKGVILMKKYCKAHPAAGSFFVTCLVLLVFAALMTAVQILEGAYVGSFGQLLLSVLMYTFLSFCVVYPFVLTAAEAVLLFTKPSKQTALGFDAITLILGCLLTPLYGSIMDIIYTADFDQTLYNTELHTPIFTEAVPTVIVLLLCGFIGYLILSLIDTNHLPPLVIVGAIAGMYLACGTMLVWCIQMAEHFSFFMILLPLNVLMIAARTIRDTIRAWNAASHPTPVTGHPVLLWVRTVLTKSALWPVLALVAALPLLGILLCILVLFGQQPNDMIRAWTETADWTLSQRIPPQNLVRDDHYLCTVAAGGDPKVVKPLRKGIRKNHTIIVNRQLCIANAFEQILEEKTPRLHRHVRHFYDTYGFPIAKLIHTPAAADLVYFIMKPLEWVFLVVLYLTDLHPEDRIALQYTGKTLKDFPATQEG